MSATTSGVPQGTTVQRGARVLRVPPPLYYAAAFAAGMLLRGATVPLAIGARPATGVVGVAVSRGRACARTRRRRPGRAAPHDDRSAPPGVGAGDHRRVPTLPQPDVHRTGPRLPRWRTAGRLMVAARDIAVRAACRPPYRHRPRRTLPRQLFRTDVHRLPSARPALAVAGHTTARAKEPTPRRPRWSGKGRRRVLVCTRDRCGCGGPGKTRTQVWWVARWSPISAATFAGASRWGKCPTWSSTTR